MTAIRDAVLLATLPHVPFEGWTDKAMRLGAVEAGYDPTMAERAFPGGPVELVDHFSDYADRQLVADLAAHGLEGLRTPDKVKLAVRLRLQAWEPHREAAVRAMSLLTLPQNGPTALRSLWRTVDIIWRAVGDQSADFAWYTKRASLSAIFSSTLLVWLEDKSEDSAETWGFLDRRIADMGRIHKAKGKMGGVLDALPNPFRLRGAVPGARRRFGIHKHG